MCQIRKEFYIKPNPVKKQTYTVTEYERSNHGFFENLIESGQFEFKMVNKIYNMSSKIYLYVISCQGGNEIHIDIEQEIEDKCDHS